MRTLIAALLAIGLSVGVPAAQEAARPASVQATVGSPVNLNTATATQLESLPGIGPATAKRIVDYRQQNGGFKRVEDLMNVRGIGEASFLKLKSLVTVAQPRAERASSQGQ